MDFPPPKVYNPVVEIQTITDRPSLEEYFRRDLPLHLYSLGDLDDFYWPQTTVYGTRDEAGLKNITPFFRGEDLPVLLAFGELNPEYLRTLKSLLPPEFYAHLGPGLEEVFLDGYQVRDWGKHYKMILADPGPISRSSIDGTARLTEKDLAELQRLYQLSYPGNAFDPRSLLTGMYIGAHQGGELVSAAGVHVYSNCYRVAALGNITTHPAYRGRGFGRAVTARLCHDLLTSVDAIGLNVHWRNEPALSLYAALGFRICAEYGEFSLQKRA